jgi:hypothetical protein
MPVRFVVLVLAACLLALFCGAAAQAAPPQTVVIDYPDFSGGAPGLQLNKAAALTGSSLQLTPAEPFKRGSSFSRTEIQPGGTSNPGGSFATEFELRMHDSSTEVFADGKHFADGIAFVLQPGSAEAIGKAGGSMGYQGIAPSIEVEFDLFRNTEFTDPEAPNVSLLQNGEPITHLATSKEPLGFPLYGAEPVWAWIEYDAEKTELSVYAINSAIKPAKPAAPLFITTIDLASVLGSEYAFAGFTSGTGQYDAVQEVLSWQLRSDLPTRFVPPPPAPQPPPSPPPSPAVAHASATRATCSLVVASASDSCVATVSDTATSGANNPTGKVSFAGGSGGAFSLGNSCSLAPVPASPSASSCAVQFFPPTNAAPLPSLTATYAGDSGHGASSGVTSYVPASALGKEVSVSTSARLSATGGQVEVPVLCHFACGVAGELTSGSNFSAETAVKRIALGKGSMRLGKPGKGVLRITLNAKARRALRKAAGRAVKGILKATVRTASGMIVKLEKKTVAVRPHRSKVRPKHG